MDRRHGFLLMMTALALGLMTVFALKGRNQTRLYRWTQRLFWSGLLLWGGGQMGLIGLNGLHWALVAGLGWPGYAALTVIRLM